MDTTEHNSLLEILSEQYTTDGFSKHEQDMELKFIAKKSSRTIKIQIATESIIITDGYNEYKIPSRPKHKETSDLITYSICMDILCPMKESKDLRSVLEAYFDLNLDTTKITPLCQEGLISRPQPLKVLFFDLESIHSTPRTSVLHPSTEPDSLCQTPFEVPSPEAEKPQLAPQGPKMPVYHHSNPPLKAHRIAKKYMEKNP